MTKSNVKSPGNYAALEDEIQDGMEDAPNAPRMATVRVPLPPKDLNNYELRMRSHAQRCVAGR